MSVPDDGDLKYEMQSEEWANVLTHGVGVCLSLTGATVLLGRALQNAEAAQVIGCGIYLLSLIAVYTTSTLSHFVRRPHLRHLFRILDQAFIYLLIVGTYTPVAIAYLHGGGLSVLFGAMWCVALVGVLSKVLLRHRIETISTVTYLVLGWMPILATQSALVLIPAPILILFAAGGVCYTIGVYFLVNDTRVRYFHAVWHLFVMAGSICHFLAVYDCVTA